MKIENGILTFASTGRTVNFYGQTSISLNQEAENVYYGSDGAVHIGDDPHYNGCRCTPAECVELADAMLVLWLKFREKHAVAVPAEPAGMKLTPFCPACGAANNCSWCKPKGAVLRSWSPAELAWYHRRGLTPPTETLSTPAPAVPAAPALPPSEEGGTDVLDDRAFYELMQAYRHEVDGQAGAAAKFEAVKAFVRGLLVKP